MTIPGISAFRCYSRGFDVRTFAVKARPVGEAAEGLRPGMSVLVDWDAIER